MFSWHTMLHHCPTVCGLCLNNDTRVTAMQTCDMLASIPKIIAPSIGSVLLIFFTHKQNHNSDFSGISILYIIATVGFLITFLAVKKWYLDPSFLIKQRRPIKLADKKESFVTIKNLLNQKKYLNLKLLIITLSLIQIPWFVLNIYVPLFAQQAKNASPLIIGLMQSAFWACTLLLAIPAGRLADRFGRKTTITFFLLISILSFIMLSTAQSQFMLIISGFFQGFVFFSVVTSGGMAAEAVSKEYMVEWFGFQGLLKGIMAQIGNVSSGTLWGIFGPFSLIFLLIICQFSAIILLRMLPETQVLKLENENTVTASSNS